MTTLSLVHILTHSLFERTVQITSLGLYFYNFLNIQLMINLYPVRNRFIFR
jgi:hypothetical protein